MEHNYYYNSDTKEIKDCLGSYLDSRSKEYILSLGFVEISQLEYEILSLTNKLGVSLKYVEQVAIKMQKDNIK